MLERDGYILVTYDFSYFSPFFKANVFAIFGGSSFCIKHRPEHAAPLTFEKCPMNTSSSVQLPSLNKSRLPSLTGGRNLVFVSQGLRMRYAPAKRNTWNPVILKARNDIEYENYLLRKRIRSIDQSLATFRKRIADACKQYRDNGVISGSCDDALMPRRRKPRKLPPFR